MSVKTRRKRLLAVSATTVAASALLGPGPAHVRPPMPLAPPCNDYGFNGHNVFIQSNGARVEFDATGRSATGTAVAILDNGSQNHGAFTASVGGRSVHLDVDWNGGARGQYTGTVGDDNFVENGFTYDKSAPESSASWHSFTQFKCLAAPPPPPAPPQKATATVTGDVDVYNIAQGDEPDENGVRGVVIGMLRAGQQVELGGPCKPNDWCKVLVPELPGGNGFVWGHLQF
jgi:hypothetical protein